LWSRAKNQETLTHKITRARRFGGVGQVVEHLTSKLKTLSPKKKKERKKERKKARKQASNGKSMECSSFHKSKEGLFSS
jgi:hypothetical protein